MQTEVVINNGVTIAGKTIIEHLEAVNHARAYDMVLSLRANKQAVSERFILDIHEAILSGIDNQNAGRYRNINVRISGSSTILPNCQKVPTLMERFVDGIERIDSPIIASLLLHYELVTIHPFTDGNGRTARLVMNYILMNNGYPPIVIHKKDRLKYLHSLEKAQTKASYRGYINLMLGRLEKSLDLCINSYNSVKSEHPHNTKLYKISEFSKVSGVEVSTLRHWIKSRILTPASVTDSGYQMFSDDSLARVKEILEMKKRRMTIEEMGQ